MCVENTVEGFTAKLSRRLHPMRNRSRSKSLPIDWKYTAVVGVQPCLQCGADTKCPFNNEVHGAIADVQRYDGRGDVCRART
jgi:hypothetical protein